MQEGLTFDDILLLPRFSNIRSRDISLETKLSRNLTLRAPLMSAPMDTVTEHRMAIALALAGGIGIIHRNLAPEAQANEIRLVKRFENGFIVDPVTIGPDETISKVYKIRQERGYKKVPVVGKNGRLAGLITSLDYFWPDDKAKKVRELMTRVKDLATAPDNITLARANEIIRKKKLDILCLVSAKGKLSAIVTRRDLEKNETYPNANKDSHKRLRVGGAVSFKEDSFERAKILLEAGVDVLVIDTAHGHSQGVLEMLSRLKKDKITRDIDVIAGNIGTAEGAAALIAAGADAVKVGIGPGSICTTRVIAGIGVPQITAVLEAVKGRGKRKDVPIIADGGIKYSGDIVKALAAGADSVMIGGLFAGTDEAPGETEYFGGRMHKTYRGMGSISAMKRGSAERYGQYAVSEDDKFIPEGIEGRVLYRGPVDKTIYQLLGGLKAGLAYAGARTITELQKKAQFVKITNAGLRESHPHDVEITKESPNYQPS